MGFSRLFGVDPGLTNREQRHIQYVMCHRHLSLTCHMGHCVWCPDTYCTTFCTLQMNDETEHQLETRLKLLSHNVVIRMLMSLTQGHKLLPLELVQDEQQSTFGSLTKVGCVVLLFFFINQQLSWNITEQM